jgi:hypothetical protein
VYFLRSRQPSKGQGLYYTSHSPTDSHSQKAANMTDRLSDINRTWTALRRRADRSPDRDRLHDAFVEADYFSPASEPDSMVLFGRRGAGKTHTLLELEHVVRAGGDIPVYIDMRRLGSNSGIYDNPEMPFSTRASRLLIDLIEVVYESLFQLSLSENNAGLDLSKLGPALDDLGEASTQVRVSGTISVTHGSSNKVNRSTSRKATARIARDKAGLDLSLASAQDRAEEDSFALTREGTEDFHIHLGTLEGAIDGVCGALDGRFLWLLVDEWSEAIPYELQPVLADMLRRTFMRFPYVTVKIMAIEHRSNFREPAGRGGYVGLELGADTAETVSLDESLTIGEDATRTSDFVQMLLCEHFLAVAKERNKPELFCLSADHIVKASFHEAAFTTLVHASEGNPRDAMNLVSKAARAAGHRVIARRDVLQAADQYFWNTKYKNIEGERPLENLFQELLQQSLERGRRTFLVSRTDQRRPFYNSLYDQRLIHLLRSGIRSSSDGSAFDGYAIDFGSYADRVLSGSLRWTNDGWASTRSFFVDDKDPEWRDAIVGRR